MKHTYIEPRVFAGMVLLIVCLQEVVLVSIQTEEVRSRMSFSLYDSGTTNDYDRKLLEGSRQLLGYDIVGLASQAVANIRARSNETVLATDTNSWANEGEVGTNLAFVNQAVILERTEEDIKGLSRREVLRADLRRSVNRTTATDWVQWAILARTRTDDVGCLAAELLTDLLGECSEGQVLNDGQLENRTGEKVPAQRLSKDSARRVVEFFERHAGEPDGGCPGWAALELYKRGMTNGLSLRVQEFARDIYVRMYRPEDPYIRVSLWPGMTNEYYRKAVIPGSELLGQDIVKSAQQAVSNIMSRTNALVVVADEGSWKSGWESVTGRTTCAEGVLLKRMYVKIEPRGFYPMRILRDDLYRNLNRTNSMDWVRWAMLEKFNRTHSGSVAGIAECLLETVVEGIPEESTGRTGYQENRSAMRKILNQKDEDEVVRWFLLMANSQEDLSHCGNLAGMALYRAGLTNGLTQWAKEQIYKDLEQRKQIRF